MKKIAKHHGHFLKQIHSLLDLPITMNINVGKSSIRSESILVIVTTQTVSRKRG